MQFKSILKQTSNSKVGLKEVVFTQRLQRHLSPEASPAEEAELLSEFAQVLAAGSHENFCQVLPQT